MGTNDLSTIVLATLRQCFGYFVFTIAYHCTHLDSADGNKWTLSKPFVNVSAIFWLICPQHTPLHPFGHADEHRLMFQHSLGYFVLTADLGLECVSC